MILLPQPPKQLGLRAHATMPGYFFCILVEMRFHCVSQSGVELLSSGNQPVLASQSAGITGMSHCACPILLLFINYGGIVGLVKD